MPGGDLFVAFGLLRTPNELRLRRHYGGLKRLVAHRPRLVYYVVYYPLVANYINSYWEIAEKFKDKYEVFGGLV